MKVSPRLGMKTFANIQPNYLSYVRAVGLLCQFEQMYSGSNNCIRGHLKARA